MPTETAPVASPETTAQPKPASDAVPTRADGTVDIEQYARIAQAGIDDERAALEAEAKPKEAEPAAKKPAVERGADGKFKAPDAKPKDEPAKADKPDKPDATEEPVVGSIAKARRLWAAGKLDEWSVLTTGKPLSELHVPSRAFVAARDERHAAAKAREEVVKLASNAKAELAPLYAGKQAADAGDYEAACQHVFKCSLLEFQKRVVGAMAKGSRGVDPEVLSLRKELDAIKAERKRDAEERAMRDQTQTREQAIAAERKSLQENLASIDGAIGAKASNRVFVDEVIRQLQSYYDPRTRATIPIQEAAQLAYEEIYGEQAEDAPVERKSTSQTVPGPKPARSAKAENLRRSEAAESAPAVPFEPGSPELLQHFARQAANALMREKMNGAG